MHAPLFSYRTLSTCLKIVFAIYGINFILLGFLKSPGDYDHLASYYEIAWRYWRYGSGQPHFNPLLCGGRPLAADPQVPIFHPLVPLVPLLGSVWLIKLELLFQLGLGAIGLIGMGRRLRLGKEAIAWCLLCFTCGGAIVNRFLVGHVAAGFYLMMPMFFSMSYELHDRTPNRLLLLKYWALFYYAYLHKPNFPIYVVPTLLVEVLLRSFTTRQLRPLLHFAIAATIGALLNAPTYLTAHEYFSLYPRITDGIPNSIPIHTLLLNFLFPLKTLPESGYGPHYFGRHEFSLFLGMAPVVMALWGTLRLARHSDGSSADASVTSFERRLWFSLVAWSLFSIGIGLGTDSPGLSLFRPYTWFHQFWPGFESVRVPPRFWFAPFLVTILLSGAGLGIPIRLHKGLLFVVGIVPLLLHAGINLSKTTILTEGPQWNGKNVFESSFSWVFSDERHNYEPIRAGNGVVNCFSNLAIPQGPISEGPLLPKIPGIELDWNGWNRISVEGVTALETKIAFNLNHAHYWRFEGTGATIESHDGELLSLTAIGHRVSGELVYELPRLRLGLGIALATVLLGLLLLRIMFPRIVWKRGEIQ